MSLLDPSILIQLPWLAFGFLFVGSSVCLSIYLFTWFTCWLAGFVDKATCYLIGSTNLLAYYQVFLELRLDTRFVVGLTGGSRDRRFS